MFIVETPLYVMLKFSINKQNAFIYIFGSLLAAVFFILVFAIVKQKSTEQEFQLFKQNTGKIISALQQLELALQEYKEAEHNNDFFIYKRDAQSEKVYHYLTEIKNIQAEINPDNPFLTAELSHKLNLFKEFTKDFDAGFTLLNDNVFHLGNGKYGYAAAIKLSENKNDKILKSYPDLYREFQELKNAKNKLFSDANKLGEEDFLKEEKQFLDALKLYEPFFESISEKQILINNINDWLNIVQQYFKLLKINGTEHYAGIYGELVEALRLQETRMFEINASVLINKSENDAKFRVIYILLSLFVGLIAFFSGIFIIKRSNRQMQVVRSLLSEMHYSEKNTESADAFEAIKQLIADIEKDSLQKLTFIQHLKAKNFAEIKTGFEQKDKLGNALIDLKKHLEREENKKLEAQKQREIWDRHKDGIVQFGKIIRQHIGSIKELTDNLLPELIDFVKADIGGIYIKEEDSDIFKLSASYAYNKKKAFEKEIKTGEGLAGTCAADKSTIYVDKLDDDYIKIVSGFGYSKPKNLLLVPVFTKEEVYGVIELAAFNIFNEHNIQFLEVLAEDIAYTIAYLRQKN